METVLFLVQEDDEYECASVLNSHTQDVKQIKWHPEDEVQKEQYLQSGQSFSFTNFLLSNSIE